MRFFAPLVAAIALMLAAPAAAQEFGISEIRGGVMFHSTDPFTAPDAFSRLQDVNFEVLFTAPYLDSFTWLGGSLKPRIGGTINFGGLESMVNLGLTWHQPIFDTPIWIEGTFGGAVHNGALHGAVHPARSFGCPLAFYEAASIGADVSDTMTVMLTVEHASHAGLCGVDNRGLTNLGVRLGYKF